MAEPAQHHVTLGIARHTLWHFGDTYLGAEGGHFVVRLLKLLSAADSENLEKLRREYPGYVEAFLAVGRRDWGLEWLRTMVKRAEARSDRSDDLIDQPTDLNALVLP